MVDRYRALTPWLIPAIVALAVSVIAHHVARQAALGHSDIVATFYSFHDGWEEYRELRQEWRGRILSNALAGVAVEFAEARHGLTDPTENVVYVAGWWTMGWLLATFAPLIALARERALLYIFGLFGALAFAYTHGIGFTRIYPWDGPTLFFFTCFVALLMLRRLELLVVLVPLATLFKETALIMPIALLLWDAAPMRRRIWLAALTLFIALAAKGFVDVVTENPSFILTMTGQQTGEEMRIITNARRLLETDVLRHPLLVNAGFAVALFIVPISDRRITILKVLGAILVAANLAFGVVNEYRIWFELVPISLYAVCLFVFDYAGVRPPPDIRSARA